MKLNNSKRRLILRLSVLMLLISLVFTTVVSAASEITVNKSNHAYTMTIVDGNADEILFCTYKGKNLSVVVNGQRTDKITYTKAGEEVIEFPNGVGYALYCTDGNITNNLEAIQKIIWASYGFMTAEEGNSFCDVPSVSTSSSISSSSTTGSTNTRITVDDTIDNTTSVKDSINFDESAFKEKLKNIYVDNIKVSLNEYSLQQELKNTIKKYLVYNQSASQKEKVQTIVDDTINEEIESGSIKRYKTELMASTQNKQVAENQTNYIITKLRQISINAIDEAISEVEADTSAGKEDSKKVIEATENMLEKNKKSIEAQERKAIEASQTTYDKELDEYSKDNTGTSEDIENTNEDKSSGTVLISGARDYEIVAKEIFSNIKDGQMFKTTTKEDDVKILVDQINGTYTAGPYVLELNVADASDNSQKILYNHLTNNISKGLKQIAELKSIDGIDGTNIVLVDENGKEISFPDFVSKKPFYVRFKPNNSGAIANTGIPKINVTYIAGFSNKKVGETTQTTPGTQGTTEVTVTGGNVHISGTKYQVKELVIDNFIYAANENEKSKVTVETDNITISHKDFEVEQKEHTTPSSSEIDHYSYNVEIKNVKVKVDAEVKVSIESSNGEIEGTLKLSQFEIEIDDSFNKDNVISNSKNKLNEEYVKGYFTSTYSKELEAWVKDQIQNGDYKIVEKSYELGKMTLSSEEASETNICAPGVEDLIQPTIGIKNKGTPGKTVTIPEVEKIPKWADASVTLPKKNINMQIGGNVWIDNPEVKTGNIDGLRKIGNSDDSAYAGIQVQLYELNNSSDKTGTLVATTTTDANGKYKFYGLVNGKALINPLKKYYIRYTYNGQIYQSTYYKNNLTGGFSNAKDESRDALNNRFATIYSETQNYKTSEWRKSFALYEKLENDQHQFITYKGNDDNDALTYKDAWDKFVEYATNSKSVTEPEYNDSTLEWSKTNKEVVSWTGIDYKATKTWTDTNYDEAFTKLLDWLKNTEKVNATEAENVVKFMQDSMISATTLQTENNKNVVYPVYNRFVIENIDKDSDDYTKNKGIEMYPNKDAANKNKKETYNYVYSVSSDQSRYVDYGITARVINDLALQKDVYKATVIVNGKKEDYIYNKKDLDDDGSWRVETRASDTLYNGQEVYNREVRKSEYLYNGADGYGANGSNIKNLQVYVTYRIAVKNQGNVEAKVNEIIDYYDASAYTFDGELDSNGQLKKDSNGAYINKTYNEYNENGEVTNKYVNSYVGTNAKGQQMDNATLTVKPVGIDKDNGVTRGPKTLKVDGKYEYSSLYITGLKSTSGNDYIKPGEMAFAYVTFKVNTDSTTNRVQLDQDLTTGDLKIGKRNIAEINAYSTRYTQNAKIPNSLGAQDKDGIYVRNDTDVTGKVAGLIDSDSNPGSLSIYDLNDKDANHYGDIITSENVVQDRQEDDTDKAPNLKLIINPNEDENRILSGYVYEDERTVKSNDQKTSVGDGDYNKDETKVNGVTIELVELVQNVDSNGIFTGKYVGEKLWESYTYSVNQNGSISATVSESEYWSGKGEAKTIITGTGNVLAVKVPDELAKTLKESGQYAFVSVPTGDFYIRFRYGDTTRTTLKSGSNEVNDVIGTSGLNEKSYNGQDFKATVYQSGIDQSKLSYNGVKGFTDYDKQNYIDNKSEYDNYVKGIVVAKDHMYVYDFDAADKASAGISDAKDVLYYRTRANDYSKDQVNYKAEVLASFEKLATYVPTKEDKSIDEAARKANQTNMINELMSNTFMVAQTGIINTEVEYNSKSINYNDNQKYTVGNINLGLSERPVAQLKMIKNVSNLRLTLANGNALFDTNKSVNNLYYAQHAGHNIGYTNFRLTTAAVNQRNTKTTPELLQGYIDDELMEGATLTVDYTIAVQNVGEVDYKDNQFYYTGKTNNASESNVSKTTAQDVIDYVSNAIQYEASTGNNATNWTLKSANELSTNTAVGSKNDLVNRQYYNELSTYNKLITTTKLNKNLTPDIYNSNNSLVSTGLVLSTVLSSNVAGGNNLVYNNLSEITHVTNELGRRMKFSIVGNQRMADQNLGDNASNDAFSKVDSVTPSEIDADSAQKIVLMPPTGQNKNYIPVIVSLIAAAGLIVAAVVIIKKNILKNNAQ